MPQLGFWRAMFTEDAQGRIWCALRIAFALAVVTYLALSIVHVAVNRAPFDPISFGTGFAALITGAGAAIFFNGRSEAAAPASPQDVNPKGT